MQSVVLFFIFYFYFSLFFFYNLGGILRLLRTLRVRAGGGRAFRGPLLAGFPLAAAAPSGVIRSICAFV
jgi:hypothetical protein